MPSVNYFLADHDDFCPAIINQCMADCSCGTGVEIRAVSEREYIRAVKLTRSQRRAAEREAARAMRKAARK